MLKTGVFACSQFTEIANKMNESRLKDKLKGVAIYSLLVLLLHFWLAMHLAFTVHNCFLQEV